MAQAGGVKESVDAVIGARVDDGPRVGPQCFVGLREELHSSFGEYLISGFSTGRRVSFVETFSKLRAAMFPRASTRGWLT